MESGGEQPWLSTRLLVFVYQARGGPASPEAACPPLASPTTREGQRRTARQDQLPGRPRAAAVPVATAAVRAPAKGSQCLFPCLLRAELGRPGRDGFLCLFSRPIPFPPRRASRPGCAGRAAGSVADDGEALERRSDFRPLLREPRADGLMGQKRSVKGDRSGL